MESRTDSSSGLLYRLDSTTDTDTAVITVTAVITGLGTYLLGPSGELTIPATISDAEGTYSVTAISNYVFYEHTNIISVILPASLTTIGDNAFLGCTALTSIVLPASLTSIGSNAFNGCTALTSIVLPASLTTIGPDAFFGCTSLTSIVLPASLTTIGNQAFARCIALENITLPTSLTTIGSSAFYSCYALTSIVLPASLTTISNYAFSRCTSLENITLPTNLTTIDERAFSECTALTSISITLPTSLTTIGNRAFNGCTALTSIVLPASLTTISYYAFQSCSDLSSVIFEGGYSANFDTYAFGFEVYPKSTFAATNLSTWSGHLDHFVGYTITQLESPTSAPTITSGDTASFAENGTGTVYTATSDVSGVTYSIGDTDDAALFDISASTGIVTFVSPPNYEAPGDDGSNNVYNITVIASKDGLTSAPQAVAITVTNVTEALDFIVSGSVATITGLGTYNLGPSGELTIPATVSDATGTYSVTAISDYVNPLSTVFFERTDIKSVILPASLISIGSYAFNGCTALTSIVLPASLTTIGPDAFNGCTALTSIVLPASLTTIGYDAFADCSDLSSVIFEGGYMEYFDHYAFGTVVYPIETFAARNITQWSDHLDNFLGYTLTQVGSSTSAPTITSGETASFAENGTGTVYTATANVSGVTYSISDTDDAAMFYINASTGIVTFVSPPNYEDATDNGGDNVYNITVSAEKDGLTSAPQNVAITVTNVNDAPTITSGETAYFDENATGTVYTATAAVSGVAVSGATYLIGGTDAARFNINASTGVVIFVNPPNFEAPGDAGANNVYNITVSARKDGLTSAPQAVAITVENVDVDDAPMITSGATASFAGNRIGPVYTATADFVGVTYSIDGLQAALFDINASTGVVTFKSPPDRAAGVAADPVYEITVTASKDGLTSAPHNVAITVTENNNAPPLITSGATASFAENATGTVYTATVDVLDVTYTIEDTDDAALFYIDDITGVVTFVNPPNFEAPGDAGTNNVYNITVIAHSFNLGNSLPKAVAITVTNVADAPMITSGDTASFAENATGTVYTATADVSGVTYSISDTDDAAMFYINASTGVVTFVNPPNFEAPGDDGSNNVYEITVTASKDGLTSSAKAVEITVTNIHEAPPAPTVSSGTQTFYNGALVSELVSSITVIEGATLYINGANVNTTDLLVSGFYSITQSSNGLTSSASTVVVSVVPLPAPSASSQTLPAGSTVADLSATPIVGANLKWYTTSTGGSALATNIPLVAGTYYVSQQLDHYDESARTSVTVTILLSAPTNLIVTPINGGLSVAFTAGAGSPITGYKYRLDGAGDWIAATTSSSPIVITGLVKKEYTVSIRAVSDGVDGYESVESASATPRYLDFIASGSVATIIGLGTYDLGPSGALTIPATVSNAQGSYSVTAIRGFNSHTNITSITLPASLITIGLSTFTACSALTSITLPASLTMIGLSAFTACSALTSITLPASLTTMGSNAFARCGLTSVIFEGGYSATFHSGAFGTGEDLNIVYSIATFTATNLSAWSGHLDHFTGHTLTSASAAATTAATAKTFIDADGEINVPSSSTELSSTVTAAGITVSSSVTNIDDAVDTFLDTLLALATSESERTKARNMAKQFEAAAFKEMKEEGKTEESASNVKQHLESFLAENPGTVTQAAIDLAADMEAAGTPIPVRYADIPIDENGNATAPGEISLSPPSDNNVVSIIAPHGMDISLNLTVPFDSLNVTFSIMRSAANLITAVIGGEYVSSITATTMDTPPITIPIPLASPVPAGIVFTVNTTKGSSFNLTILSVANINITITPNGSIPCFAEGTRVLTQSGYKTMETLDDKTDRIVTADHRVIPFKLLKTKLSRTTERTAPYLIQPHAFGHNLPSAPIRLSAIHKISIGKGKWTSPEKAALTNPLVKQCEIGGPMKYYHIECANYLKDDIVTEGLVVESFGSKKATKGKTDIYKWSARLNAYTRVAPGSVSYSNVI